MKIGIDVSQIAHRNTGVANYLQNLVQNILRVDTENEYVLFFSSLRRNFHWSLFNLESIPPNVTVRTFRFPPLLLDVIWNRLHIAPIEWFIGSVDIFISSDWVQPPSKSKNVTVLYDLIVFKHPEETHNKFGFNPLKLLVSPNIVASQKRRLKWVKKECDMILCISEATKKDAMELLGISESKLRVTYPGVSI